MKKFYCMCGMEMLQSWMKIKTDDGNDDSHCVYEQGKYYCAECGKEVSQIRSPVFNNAVL